MGRKPMAKRWPDEQKPHRRTHRMRGRINAKRFGGVTADDEVAPRRDEGVIALSTGSARVTPAPRRNVRRESGRESARCMNEGKRERAASWGWMTV